MTNGSREDRLGCRCCALLPLENMSEHHMVLLELHKVIYQLDHKHVVLLPALACNTPMWQCVYGTRPVSAHS